MKYKLKKGKYPDPPKDSDTVFYGKDGNAWRVEFVNGTYYFKFMSGDLSGRGREFEISKEDYNLTRSGKIGFHELMAKYVDNG